MEELLVIFFHCCFQRGHFYIVWFWCTVLDTVFWCKILFFQSNTKILTLDLSDNWLNPQGGIAIAEMLTENCYISELVPSVAFLQFVTNILL